MKRKVWDITVKGSTNRVAISENDEFYTTDTEAFLVFNLQDKFFVPQSAMITLENRNDGSLKSEEVEVVGGKIKWEMPERYIEHFGNWQVQVVYETKESGQIEKYTSGVMSFNVNSHIGDKKKPSLVEIENWEKFIREGTELIETWEDLEALREENERQRQANYQELLDTGVLQTNINTKLEQLEEEYAPKLTEVTAQLAQKASKEEIRSIVDGSPKGVFATFEELESSYPNGTSGVYVVSSDGKWYYWNGDEWVGGGVYQSTVSSDFPATNKVVNGDFKDGTTRWNETSGATLNGITDGAVSVIGNGNSTLVGITQTLSAVPLDNKLYGRVMVKLVGFSSTVRFNVGDDVFSRQDIEADTWTELSGIISKPVTSVLAVQAVFDDTSSALNKEIQIKFVMAVDLTEAFGSFNIPTSSEFDSILEAYPNKHFNGTVSPLVRNREAFQKSMSIESVLKNVKLKQDLTYNNVVLFDDFNRNNGDLGDEVFGETWNTNMPGTNIWSIVNGKANCSTPGGVRQAYINAKASDFDLSCDIEFTSNAGLSFRQSRVYGEGASMFIFRINTTSATLFKYSNSDNSTTIGTFEGAFSPGSKYNLRVIAIGSSIKCYVDGALVIEVVDGHNSEETYCGLVSTSSPNELFDDFKIKKVEKPINVQDFSKPEPIENVFTLDLSKTSNFEITNETIDTKEIDFKNVSAGVNDLLVVSVKLNNLASSNFIYPSGTLWQDNDVPTFQYSTYMLLFISYDGGASWLASYVGGW